MVNESPLISVVIPVKNGENYLESAINSVIDQNYENFELIIGINPSTDGTQKIANSYRDHPKIKVVEFKDSVNMPENFNRSALFANGKYLKFLCHDDLLMPNNLMQLSTIMENYESVGLVTCYEKMIQSKNYIRGEKSFGNLANISLIRALYRFFKYNNWVGGPSAVLIRTAPFKHHGFKSYLECAFDLEYWLRISMNNEIYIVSEVLYQSRVHENQGSNHCQQGGFMKDLRKIRSQFVFTYVKEKFKFLKVLIINLFG